MDASRICPGQGHLFGHSVTRPELLEYDLYHDESKEDGYWHGILFVPRNARAAVSQWLERIRHNASYPHPLTFKALRKPGGGSLHRCARAWVGFAVASLIQNLKGRKFSFETGMKKKGEGQYELLSSAIGARFVLMRVRDGLSSMEGYPDDAAKVETTFWMAVKGGLHLFADESERLVVSSFHFDGHKHYGRRVDVSRIVQRIGRLRKEVSIPENLTVDDASSDHSRDDAQAYEDCQFLQLSDLLLGSFRSVLMGRSNLAQSEVANPVKVLVDDWRKGHRRMANSRWYKAYCVSECWLESGEWGFGDIKSPELEGQRVLPGVSRGD